ncbi:MAG: DUF998 domain-containing protein [archaeon]|nr:MAG: DUF998 domain-containing protein [archaeon]
MALSDAAKTGAAIFVGAVQFGIFLVVAEALYPEYSVYGNAISDLGANCTDGVCVIQPSSSLVFEASVIILGLLVITGAYYFMRAFKWKPGAAIVGIAGLGAVGVGLFPETTGAVHGIFSLITFLFAGLSALVVARFQRKPMFYFSIILGSLTLVALLLYASKLYLGLGQGGMERMVAYPALLWAVGFGGHLMNLD